MRAWNLKLIDQFTLWFLIVTAVVLLIGGMIVFTIVQKEIILEDARRLKDTVRLLAKNLQEGTAIEQLDGYQVDIQELDVASSEVPLQLKDTLVWFPPHQHYERELRAEASYKINGRHYHIAASNLVAEPDDIADGVIKSISWTLILLLVLVGFLSRFLSRRLLAPFHQTLNAVESFSLTKQAPLRLASAQTREFEKLNHFLQEMTSKAVDDYRSLKEFTENASHELQTPLAVIRGKLELLMNSPITDKQAELIMAAHDAVEKLSKTNQALSLLTRLENGEYKATEVINLSAALQHTLNAFLELFEMKSLTLEEKVEEKVHVHLNASLASIFLNNLLSNAIRHNHPQGKVLVTLTFEKLLICNTGKPPLIPTELLFQRFKKNNQSDDSTGLGLAIIKQICELNGFKISYLYEDGWHKVEVLFKPNDNK